MNRRKKTKNRALHTLTAKNTNKKTKKKTKRLTYVKGVRQTGANLICRRIRLLMTVPCWFEQRHWYVPLRQRWTRCSTSDWLLSMTPWEGKEKKKIETIEIGRGERENVEKYKRQRTLTIDWAQNSAKNILDKKYFFPKFLVSTCLAKV